MVGGRFFSLSIIKLWTKRAGAGTVGVSPNTHKEIHTRITKIVRSERGAPVARALIGGHTFRTY